MRGKNIILHTIIFAVMVFSGFSLVQKGGNQTTEMLLWCTTLLCANFIILKPSRNLKEIFLTGIWLLVTLPITLLISLILLYKVIDLMSFKFHHDYEIWTLNYSQGFLIRIICWVIFGVLNYSVCYLFILLKRKLSLRTNIV